MEREDLYDVLGLEPGASPEQVERAYRFSLEMYDQDALATYSLLQPVELAAERARIQEAHDVLADPEQRRAYDEAHGFAPPESSTVPIPPHGGSGTEEVELPEVLSGADLQRIRESRGVDLRRIASITKIGTRFLEYIEEDRFALLPAPVYLRGFLQEYARAIGLEPKAVARAYMRRMPSKS